jgi:hypothetical protein
MGGEVVAGVVLGGTVAVGGVTIGAGGAAGARPDPVGNPAAALACDCAAATCSCAS